MKKIIVITGPTGVGKTKLSVSLAKLLDGEIINADGYASSKLKYTNIEGGLKRAWDMLETTTVKNKYIQNSADSYYCCDSTFTENEKE
mgnify:CR=1 FL=1